MLKTFFEASTRNLIKEAHIYGAGALINKLIPVLILPILTRYLSPEEYGIVALFSVALAVAHNMIGLNLPAAIERNYVESSRAKLAADTGTAMSIILVAAVFWLAVLGIFSPVFTQLLSLPGNWLPVIIIVALFQILITIIEVLWRMERQAARFVLFQVMQTVLNLGASILFVVVFMWQWQGRLLGLAVSAVLCGGLSLYLLYRNGYLVFCFKKEAARSMLLFSTPLIFHTLSTWIVTGSDRLFIAGMVGAGAVGLYSVGYAVGQIIQLLQHAFSQAWVPHLFETLKKNRAASRLSIVRVVWMHHICILFLAFGVHLAAPFILQILVGESFQGSVEFVSWIAAGYALNGMYRMVAPFLNYTRKTHLLAAGSLAAAGLNLVLNYFLIKLNGPVGAAQATFLSYLLLYIVTFAFAAKAINMPWLTALGSSSRRTGAKEGPV